MQSTHRGKHRRDLDGRWCASMESFAANRSKADEVEAFLFANGGKSMPKEITAMAFIGGVPPKWWQSR